MFSRKSWSFWMRATTVWVIYPEPRVAVAHYPDGSSRIHAAGEELTSPLLPGFTLNIADLLK
jgi:hypothetical protein